MKSPNEIVSRNNAAQAAYDLERESANEVAYDDATAYGRTDINDELDEEPELGEGSCPLCDGGAPCDGPGIVLGSLGNRQHFRCRDCGMDFSREA